MSPRQLLSFLPLITIAGSLCEAFCAITNFAEILYRLPSLTLRRGKQIAEFRSASNKFFVCFVSFVVNDIIVS